MRKILLVLVVCVGVLSVSVSVHAQRRPLSPADIDAIATLLKLEDTRQYDEAALGQVLKSAHPEVRRRAAISIGRIADPRGLALLQSARADLNLQVRASVVFATGQIHQPESVAWLGSVLSAPATPPAVAKEAAQALGKMVRNEAARPAARAALVAYLAKAVETPASAPVIGEALLSVGRFGLGEIASIAKWAASRNAEVRWRAAWALLRPRDAAGLPHPEALSHLDKLVADPSGEVRYWAVRAFTPAPVDAAGISRPATTARLLKLSQVDPDRRVRTEALRTLLQYDDETAFGALVNALYSTDFWISGSAAEAAGRFVSRAGRLTALVADVAEPKDSLSMRATVAPSLVTLAPEARATLQLAGQLTQSEVTAGRDAGMRALGRLGDRGLAAFDQIAADPAMQGLLPSHDDFVRRFVPQPPGARAGGAAGGRAAGAGTGAGRGSAPARQPRPDAEYRQLVERWIVPDYNGAAKPHVVWETERGLIEIELYPGDAPFGVEHLMRVIDSGDIVGTEFTRLVPDFVAQQQAIRNASNLRDEVNQRGLTRANLSWASAGLDTGRPGYTLGHTPQPHNEGDFTSLGRVVKGMDAVDKLELGDKILSAKVVSAKK